MPPDAQQARALRPHRWLVLILLALSTACATANKPAPLTVEAPAESALPESSAPPPGAIQIEPTVVDAADLQAGKSQEGEPQYSDPLIGLNRAVFAFNDVAYRYALIPAAKAYRAVLPQAVRTSISRLFANLREPISMLNHLLQWEPANSGRNLARFGLNSTVGLLGLFDPAQAWFELQPTPTGFGETLEEYGAGYGVYLVVPILGPSDLRSGSGALVDAFSHPLPYVAENPEATAALVFDGFQSFTPQAERYQQLSAETDDPYIFFRNFHLQKLLRDAAYPEPD